MDCRFISLAEAELASGAAVVVDVMRAFTTAAWAFHLGASRIVLVAELEDALAWKAARPGSLACCDGAPKPGFDLFNSPAQLLSVDVTGKGIVQRTTSGTRRALAARQCSRLLCTGFVTAGSTAAVLRKAGVETVSFVLGGGDEDRACAEYIAALVTGAAADGDLVDRARRSPAALALAEGVTKGLPGVSDRDVDMCLELDRFDFTLTARRGDGTLVLEQEWPSSGGLSNSRI